MNGFLVDTNVFSEIFRPAPDGNVVAWSRSCSKQLLFLSVIAAGELRRGLILLPVGARRRQWEISIEVQLPQWFEGRVLPITRVIAERWGELDAIRQIAGSRVNPADAMIAATALEHGLTVATRNVKHFDGLGVAIFNPWEP